MFSADVVVIGKSMDRYGDIWITLDNGITLNLSKEISSANSDLHKTTGSGNIKYISIARWKVLDLIQFCPEGWEILANGFAVRLVDRQGYPVPPLTAPEPSILPRKLPELWYSITRFFRGPQARPSVLDNPNWRDPELVYEPDPSPGVMFRKDWRKPVDQGTIQEVGQYRRAKYGATTERELWDTLEPGGGRWTRIFGFRDKIPCICGCGKLTTSKQGIRAGHQFKIIALCKQVEAGIIDEKYLIPIILEYYQEWKKDKTITPGQWVGMRRAVIQRKPNDG